MSTARGMGKAVAWAREAATYQGADCLIWPFNRNESGRGTFGLDGRLLFAAPFICEIAHGPKPSPKHRASLTCGNGSKGCVNPHHLAWRTIAEANAAGAARGSYREARARRSGRRKLTIEDVAAIRALKGKMTTAAIGRRFGISHKHVIDLHANRFWVDGKPGKGGFKPDDPRNPSVRRRGRKCPLVVLGRPAARTVPEFAFLEKLIPSQLAGNVRDDIRSAMILALLDGTVTADHLTATRGADFRRAFYRDNFELGMSRRGQSFDAPLRDGGSLHDILSTEMLA